MFNPDSLRRRLRAAVAFGPTLRFLFHCVFPGFCNGSAAGEGSLPRFCGACDCQRDPGIGLLRTRVERPHKDGAIATEREEKSRRFPPGIGSAAQWQAVS